MKTFTVIQDCAGPEAFLVEQKLTTEQIKFLHNLVGGKFFDHPHLAQRWGLEMVLCERDWGSRQWKRQPMFKPKGQRMAILED